MVQTDKTKTSSLTLVATLSLVSLKEPCHILLSPRTLTWEVMHKMVSPTSQTSSEIFLKWWTTYIIIFLNRTSKWTLTGTPLPINNSSHSTSTHITNINMLVMMTLLIMKNRSRCISNNSSRTSQMRRDNFLKMRLELWLIHTQPSNTKNQLLVAVRKRTNQTVRSVLINSNLARWWRLSLAHTNSTVSASMTGLK